MEGNGMEEAFSLFDERGSVSPEGALSAIREADIELAAVVIGGKWVEGRIETACYLRVILMKYQYKLS